MDRWMTVYPTKGETTEGNENRAIKATVSLPAHLKHAPKKIYLI